MKTYKKDFANESAVIDLSEKDTKLDFLPQLHPPEFFFRAPEVRHFNPLPLPPDTG